MKIDFLFNLFGYVFEIIFVLLWQNQGFNACMMGSQNFFLYPANRQVSRDTRAVSMVTPAEGPSLGMAPAGMCT